MPPPPQHTNTEQAWFMNLEQVGGYQTLTAPHRASRREQQKPEHEETRSPIPHLMAGSSPTTVVLRAQYRLFSQTKAQETHTWDAYGSQQAQT